MFTAAQPTKLYNNLPIYQNTFPFSSILPPKSLPSIRLPAPSSHQQPCIPPRSSPSSPPPSSQPSPSLPPSTPARASAATAALSGAASAFSLPLCPSLPPAPQLCFASPCFQARPPPPHACPSVSHSTSPHVEAELTDNPSSKTNAFRCDGKGTLVESVLCPNCRIVGGNYQCN
jgi:hypothetical protein